MPVIPPLLKEAAAHLKEAGQERLQAAYALARRLYGAAVSPTGEPLLTEVESVARLLLRLQPDTATLIATLLQYAHGKEQLVAIEKAFGKKIVRIISALAVLEKGCGRMDTYSPAYLRKMTIALSEDIRVLLICLHNRWHLLEQAPHFEERMRRLVAREVLDVFAPMAARLGVYSLKYTLETLAFGILYPVEALEIEETLKKLRRKECSFLDGSTRTLKTLLSREGKHVEIIGREKHPYSIFMKMRRKGLTGMTDLHDLFGLRIIVETAEDCYRVLGVIHHVYRPIMHRLKDYIAFPKPNGYRSLHTTVQGLNVKDGSFPIEIQIRTREMHERAEYGIAAHWNYKEGGKEEPRQQRLWRERMEALRRASDSTGEGEVGDTLTEALSDRIYVLTPRGDPIELPKGATPLDFAFHIHTDIGLCFKAAKVNGAIASLDQALENGDVVEILKQKEPHPSVQWLQIARTHEARSKLRTFFRTKGAAYLLPTGHRAPAVGRIFRGTRASAWEENARQKQPRVRPSVLHPLIELEADTALPHRFAQCCAPHRSEATDAGLPPIIGFITRAGAVNIHRASCRMLEGANKERLVRASWRTMRPTTVQKQTSRRTG